MTQTKENLGPAEKIIQTLLTYSDHMFHNRPGMVVPDASSVIGLKWSPVTCKTEKDGKQIVYRMDKVGKKTNKVDVGNLSNTNLIMKGRTKVGDYRPAGVFPEVAVWMYKQISEVWKLDNEFSARWASYAFSQEHKDLKVALAAFMLCQSRKGEAIIDGGKIAFYDDDYRDVGEAMCLLYNKNQKDLNPKLLLRIREILILPGVIIINRELGFTKSDRNPFLGRWPKAVEKWLRFREENPKLLEGAVKGGWRTTIMGLARFVGYKPLTPAFFEILRWKQKQSKDGRRKIAIGKAVKAAESWAGLTEKAICKKIVATKPNWKRIIGLLPKEVGVTRAIVAAAIEADSLSNKDLIIMTPTLEELGLLQIEDIKNRWEIAIKAADDMRAANIASRVRSKETKDKLQEAAETAVKKAVEEVAKDIRIYFMVDISGSMTTSIDSAKGYLTKFLHAFPPDRIHISVFNTSGKEIILKQNTALGVTNAFKGISAGGGTHYPAGFQIFSKHKPASSEDVIFIYVGDEEAHTFADDVRKSGLNPLAFGFVKVGGSVGFRAVQNTAGELGIPCFMIDEKTFDDPYAIPRTIRALIAATPVNKLTTASGVRESLIDVIMKTNLLQKPAWAG